MISPTAFLLFSAAAHLSLALPQSTSSVSAPQFENITLTGSDPRLGFFPFCPTRTLPSCLGSWYKIQDERFTNGEAIMSSGPGDFYQNVEPYLTFSFKGSAMYMYQWVNSTTGPQGQYAPGDNTPPAINVAAMFPGDPANPGELRRVLTWKHENLDPNKSHTFGLKHFGRPGFTTQVIIDNIVITRLVGSDDDFKDKRDRSQAGKIGGAVTGSVLGALAILGISCCVIRRRRAKANSNQRHNWEGTNGAITQKFADPSAEIMQSERLAREGRIEEQKDPRASPPMPSLPLIS